MMRQNYKFDLLAETKGETIFRAAQLLTPLKMRSSDYYPSLGGKSAIQKLLVLLTVNLDCF